MQTRDAATAALVDGRRLVRGRAATGDTVAVVGRWRELYKNLDAYAARRSSETAVVVLALGADVPNPSRGS
ncbi:hypothetical protein OIE43_22015 [Streptomyces pseudovenezuelae]|uniref:hypothetical protein n=1 Tax=Streptomyces pseudovenezuelae TaxID=67350 RepID=UPI002E33FFCB|nr:hypothetical protein [Streptomyces pseudovenezuelae]